MQCLYFDSEKGICLLKRAKEGNPFKPGEGDRNTYCENKLFDKCPRFKYSKAFIEWQQGKIGK